jgi:hypothetical protein
MHTKFQSEILNGRDFLVDLGIYGRIILEWIFGKYGEELTGFIWPRIGTSDGLL